MGDTIWIERFVPAPPGWRVRAGKLAPGQPAEALADPVVFPSDGGWRVRYAAVAWVPGLVTVTMPPLWRLGPDGSADSLPGGTATVRVASVLPDSVSRPAPQPALTPLRAERHTALPALAAVLLSAGLLVAVVAWRRRPPRGAKVGPDLLLDPEIADARWLTAGEPKAVAARAAHALRSALARAVPEAHEALSTRECLATVERVRPAAPVRELRDLLGALDEVAFATAHGVDVAPLARRAEALAAELAP
ncbi:MAG TPA: hypothetical protein VGJ83_08865 [Gemmatimonadales bacterium]